MINNMKRGKIPSLPKVQPKPLAPIKETVETPAPVPVKKQDKKSTKKK